MSLTSVGNLLNKVVRIPNGSEKMRNISVSYRFQFKIMHFICSYNYISLFFYHNTSRAHISKQYHKNRNLGTVLIIRKTRNNLPPTPNFASKMVDFTTHSRFHRILSDFESIVCSLSMDLYSKSLSQSLSR